MEEVYYDAIDAYIATVKRAKTGRCEICKDPYEKEISEEDKKHLKAIRDTYDLGSVSYTHLTLPTSDLV